MPTQSVLVRTSADLRAMTTMWRQAGQTIALVPTMGALHAGHLSLVDLARRHADHVVVSIFVNPMQFAPSEDLASYPRTFEADRALLDANGPTLLYWPTVEQIYPEGFATQIDIGGPAGAGLEDRFRPQFFKGVATVVAKLLIQTGCDHAVFGEKDYQQLLVVRRLVADLDLPTGILAGPTLRDADGLALSSRNRHLSAGERQRAATLPRVLHEIASGLRRNASAGEMVRSGRSVLEEAGFAVDYLELRDAASLEPPTTIGAPLRILAAARLGTTRLIDNMAV